MNSLTIAAIAVLLLYLGYRFYGGWIERRIVLPNDDSPTPAYSCGDGVDFCPAEKPLLFGHHFSSIAGAGPIIGPVFAVAAFGWGGVVLWILLGGVFIGAVHDYLSLMVSVRNEGRSIPDVAVTAVGPFSRILFLIFVFGPCEPLIPILMFPAARGSVWHAVLIASIFAVATVGTMLTVVMVSYYGLARVRVRSLERYSHALAGLALFLSGGAITFLGL